MHNLKSHFHNFTQINKKKKYKNNEFSCVDNSKIANFESRVIITENEKCILEESSKRHPFH